MKRSTFAAAAFSAAFAVASLQAQTGQWFAARADVLPASSGTQQFDLIAVVDGEALLEIKRDTVGYRVLSGQEPRDRGTVATAPLPDYDAAELQVQQLAGREAIEIVQRPSQGNDWALLARVNDEDTGADTYHLRMTWRDSRGGSYVSAPRPGAAPTSGWGDLWNQDNQRIEVQGVGTLSINGRSFPVRGALIELASDQRFALRMYGDRTYLLEGSWRDSGQSGIALDIQRADGRAVDSTGVIRRDREGVDRIELGSSREDAVVGALRVTETGDRRPDTIDRSVSAPQPDAGTDAEPITETVKGAGRLVSAAGTKNFDAMEVYLFSNGRVELQIFGPGVKESFGGVWERRGEPRSGQERFALTLDRAFDDSRTNASGEVILGPDKHVDMLSLAGAAAQPYGDFRLTFRQH